MSALGYTLVIIFVLFFGTCFVVLHKLLRKDATSDANPSSFDLPYEEVTMQTDDGQTLHGWFISSKGAKGIVIITRSTGQTVSWVLSQTKFLYPDYHLLYVDHRGVGQSTGSPTAGMKELSDVNAAIHYIRQAFGDSPVALMGFGLSASALLQTHESIRAIVSDSAYASFNRFIGDRFGAVGSLKVVFRFGCSLLLWVRFQTWSSAISPEHEVKQQATPRMIIHGNEDGIIPVEHAKLLKDADPTTKLWLVDEAEHMQSHSMHTEQYEKSVLEFLSRVMR